MITLSKSKDISQEGKPQDLPRVAMDTAESSPPGTHNTGRTEDTTCGRPTTEDTDSSLGGRGQSLEESKPHGKVGEKAEDEEDMEEVKEKKEQEKDVEEKVDEDEEGHGPTTKWNPPDIVCKCYCQHTIHLK